jgi:hypothetical protein
MRISPPHEDDITWTRATPRPSRLDPLAAPDLATGLAHAREQAEDYRQLALTAIEQMHRQRVEIDRQAAAIARLRDELRQQRQIARAA